MNVKTVVGAGAALVAGGALFLALNGSGNEIPAGSGQRERIVRVEKGDLELAVSADGVVQPINKVEVKSKASGQILELNLTEGEEVRKGDLLVALDQTTALNDVEQARADLELARATAEQQANNRQRATELFGKGMISRQELDQATVDDVRAKSSLIKARAALSSAEERLRDTRIKAPISGIVLTKNVETGQIISSGVSNVGGGTILATLAEMDTVNVETNVDEVDIGRVQIGQRATVRADAFPDDTFPGRVVRIAPLGVTQQNVTVFNVVIEVRNRGGRLKAGMSASVEIEIFRRSQVLLLPNDALRDPRSEQGRELLAQMNAAGDSVSAGGDSVHAGARGPEGEWRGDFGSLSQEERAAMRERFLSMTPEQRMEMRQRFMQRPGAGGGPGQRGGRTRAVTGQEPPRRRIVLVKDADRFVPKMVLAGPSNYDNTEIASGLSEGDEVLVTTVSRARAAADEFNERIRSRTSMGGMGGGRPR